MFKPIITRSSVLPDVVIFKPSVSLDIRGSIFTSFDINIYKDYIPQNLNFIHDKFAESKKNVLRGLHGDTKTFKLISCVYGEILEVVVDMRPESETYLKWDSFQLSGSNKKQILVPPNFVNGYYVKSDMAVFHYKLAYDGEYFDVSDQMVVKWNDPKLNIDWGCSDPLLYGRDK